MQRPILVILAAGALAFGAGAASAQTRQCFSSTNIRGTQPVGDSQVNVRVGTRDVYRIDLATPCPGLRQASRVIDLSPTASATSICTGSDIRLGVTNNGSRTECIIDKVTKLTPDQVAALGNRERP